MYSFLIFVNGYFLSFIFGWVSSSSQPIIRLNTRCFLVSWYAANIPKLKRTYPLPKTLHRDNSLYEDSVHEYMKANQQMSSRTTNVLTELKTFNI